MVNLQTLGNQIETIMAEHKDCGGHCHMWNQKNEKLDVFKEQEHVAKIITYYVWGVIDGIHSVY
jgi:hypothetical protein